MSDTGPKREPNQRNHLTQTYGGCRANDWYSDSTNLNLGMVQIDRKTHEPQPTDLQSANR